jgi:hypothetical protein
VFPATLAAYQKWTEIQEGRLPYMYLDVEGLVHTGIGNLIDASPSGSSAPWTPALALPWKNPDGSAASPATIQAQWQAVKARQDLKGKGGGNAPFPSLTTIRLSQADIDALFQKVLSSFTETIRKYYPAIDSWPADGQMGVLGMAWALGPAFPPQWPKFTAAITKSPPDFAGAALESNIANGNLSRNRSQLLMLQNADYVQKNGLDPSKLYFPNSASSGQVGATIQPPVAPATLNKKRPMGTLSSIHISSTMTRDAAIIVFGAALGYGAYKVLRPRRLAR